MQPPHKRQRATKIYHEFLPGPETLATLSADSQCVEAVFCAHGDMDISQFKQLLLALRVVAVCIQLSVKSLLGNHNHNDKGGNHNDKGGNHVHVSVHALPTLRTSFAESPLSLSLAWYWYSWHKPIVRNQMGCVSPVEIANL